MREVSTQEMLSLAWESYKKHRTVLTEGAILLLFIHIFLYISLLETIRGNGIGVVFLFLLGIVTAIMQLGYVKILLNVTGNKPITLRQLFGNHNFSVRYVVGVFGYYFLVGVGLCLLVVPGVVYALRYSMWPFFLVNKDLDLVDSFKESKRVTKGSKKELLHLYLVCTGCVVVGALPFGLLLPVAIPVALLMVGHAYRKLQLIRTNETLEERRSLWHENY